MTETMSDENAARTLLKLIVDEDINPGEVCMKNVVFTKISSYKLDTDAANRGIKFAVTRGWLVINGYGYMLTEKGFKVA